MEMNTSLSTPINTPSASILSTPVPSTPPIQLQHIYQPPAQQSQPQPRPKPKPIIPPLPLPSSNANINFIPNEIQQREVIKIESDQEDAPINTNGIHIFSTYKYTHIFHQKHIILCVHI